jgi:hypothetical protein
MGKSKSRFPPFRQIEKLKCFDQVKALLLSGRPATRVAAAIHEQFGEMKDHEHGTLVAYLLAYRRTLSAMELAKVTQPQFVSDAMDKIDQGLDELAELAEIFQIQKSRIIQGNELEKNLKVLNRTLGNEVRIATEMLRTSHQMKVELGARSGGGSVHMNPAVAYDVQSRYGEKVARVMADPSKRTRVLEAAKRALEKGKGKDDNEEEVVQLRRAASGG